MNNNVYRIAISYCNIAYEIAQNGIEILEEQMDCALRDADMHQHVVEILSRSHDALTHIVGACEESIIPKWTTYSVVYCASENDDTELSMANELTQHMDANLYSIENLQLKCINIIHQLCAYYSSIDKVASASAYTINAKLYAINRDLADIISIARRNWSGRK